MRRDLDRRLARIPVWHHQRARQGRRAAAEAVVTVVGAGGAASAQAVRAGSGLVSMAAATAAHAGGFDEDAHMGGGGDSGALIGPAPPTLPLAASPQPFASLQAPSIPAIAPAVHARSSAAASASAVGSAGSAAAASVAIGRRPPAPAHVRALLL